MILVCIAFLATSLRITVSVSSRCCVCVWAVLKQCTLSEVCVGVGVCLCVSVCLYMCVFNNPFTSHLHHLHSCCLSRQMLLWGRLGARAVHCASGRGETGGTESAVGTVLGGDCCRATLGETERRTASDHCAPETPVSVQGQQQRTWVQTAQRAEHQKTFFNIKHYLRHSKGLTQNSASIDMTMCNIVIMKTVMIMMVTVIIAFVKELLTQVPSGPNSSRKLPMNSLDFSSHFWMRSWLFSSTR